MLTSLLSFYKQEFNMRNSATVPTLAGRSILLSMLLCGGGLLAPARALAQFRGSKASEIEKLAPLLGLKPGSAVAEIGAGSGSVALAAAEKVGPGGHVYATEIDPGLLRKMRDKVGAAGLANFTVVKASADDTGLPAGCCDAIYMIGVYHHFTEPLKTDASIFRALRPGGKLVVVDFRPSLLLKPWTPKGVPANRGGHGIPPEILEDELTRSGFKIAQVIDPWGRSWFLSNYCVVLTKPGTAP
jgi:ubiquinone/menaquinone biosynthesis C-methylase UbiE